MKSIDEVLRLRAKTTEKEAELALVREQEKLGLQKLREQVEAGKADLGDPIQNFVLVIHGSLGGPNEKKLRATQALLESHPHDMIMVVRAYEERTVIREIGEPDPHDYRLTYDLRFALLEDNPLVLDLKQEYPYLHTEGFLELEDVSYGRRKAKFIHKKMAFDWEWDLEGLNEKIKPHNHRSEFYGFGRDLPVFDLEIIAGADPIASWLEKRHFAIKYETIEAQLFEEIAKMPTKP